MQFKFKKIGKVVGLILIGLVLLFFSLKLAIQSPAVQTWAVNTVGNYLSNELDCKVTVGEVDIRFFKSIELNKVYFEDQKKDTVIYAPSILVNFSAFSIPKQRIIISEVELKIGRAHV